MVVDPLSKEYPFVSPYSYVLNNPINLYDPDGRQVFGIQIGIEFGALIGGSANLSVTYDTRGGKLNLLGSMGKGIVAGRSANLNVGVIVGEENSRTSDLLGEGVESSVDLSFALKGAGYAYSESNDTNGFATGRGAHIFSWSPGLAANVSHKKTTTIDIIDVLSSFFSSTNSEKVNDNQSNKKTDHTNKNEDEDASEYEDSNQN